MITVKDLCWSVEQWFDARQLLCDRLNAADAKLGDGDTGMTVKQIIEALQNISPGLSDDPGTALKACSQACARASGSSLGTVIALGLAGAAAAAPEQRSVSPCQLADMMAAAITRITERSGSCLGDKTILDAVENIRRNIAELGEDTLILIPAFVAANEARSLFRDKPCQVGRARVYAEKTMGVDDPGMLAVSSLLEVLVKG